MRPFQNSETEQMERVTPTPSPAGAAEDGDAYDAPTTVGPMSAAIAQMIEAEQRRQAESTKSGVRPAVTDSDAPPQPAAPKPSTAQLSTSPDGLPTIYDEAEALEDYEPTVLSPMANPELEPPVAAAEASGDVVASIVREMEEASSKAEVSAAERSASADAPKPAATSSKIPVAVPRPSGAAKAATPAAAASPVAAAEAPAAEASSSAPPPDAIAAASAPAGSTPEAEAEDAAGVASVAASGVPEASANTDEGRPHDGYRRGAARAAFPEWIGVTVRVDELAGARRDRRKLIRVGAAVGGAAVAVGVLWWFLSLV